VAGFAAALVGNLDFAIARGRLVGFDMIVLGYFLRTGKEGRMAGGRVRSSVGGRGLCSVRWLASFLFTLARCCTFVLFASWSRLGTDASA
jgi:hypothetical protein